MKAAWCLLFFLLAWFFFCLKIVPDNLSDKDKSTICDLVVDEDITRSNSYLKIKSKGTTSLMELKGSRVCAFRTNYYPPNFNKSDFDLRVDSKIPFAHVSICQAFYVEASYMVKIRSGDLLEEKGQEVGMIASNCGSGWFLENEK